MTSELERERRQASFPVKDLLLFLDGEQKLKSKERMRALVHKNPVFRKVLRVRVVQYICAAIEILKFRRTILYSWEEQRSTGDHWR